MESLPDHGHTISVTFWYKVGNQKLPNTDLVLILSYLYICTCTECDYGTVGLNFQKYFVLEIECCWRFHTKYMLLTFRYNESENEEFSKEK